MPVARVYFIFALHHYDLWMCRRVYSHMCWSMFPSHIEQKQSEQTPLLLFWGKQQAAERSQTMVLRLNICRFNFGGVNLTGSTTTWKELEPSQKKDRTTTTQMKWTTTTQMKLETRKSRTLDVSNINYSRAISKHFAIRHKSSSILIQTLRLCFSPYLLFVLLSE